MLSRTWAIVVLGMAVAACAGNPLAPSSPQPSTLVGGPPLTQAAPTPQVSSEPLPDPNASALPQAPAVPSAPPSPSVANAAIGGMFGAVGAGLDDEDKQRAYAAQVQALEAGGAGAPVAWRNPDSGHYGSIVPGPMFDRGGNKCRQYTHTIYIDSKPQTARGAACRNANGRWIPA
jgi:surface antigen